MNYVLSQRDTGNVARNWYGAVLIFKNEDDAWDYGAKRGLAQAEWRPEAAGPQFNPRAVKVEEYAP